MARRRPSHQQSVPARGARLTAPPAGAQIASRLVELAVVGGSIEVECAGEGPALVLLHGWALDRRVWQPQLALARDFTIITLDRRGFGRSSAPPGLEAEIDDLAALQDALSLGPMLLAGNSQGGRVALHFAHHHPERLAGVILDGAPLDGFQPEARGEDSIPLETYAALARSRRLDRMKELWRAHPLMRCEDEEMRRRLDAMLADYAGRDLVAGSEHGLEPIAGALGAIAMPALVITGEHDTAWRRLVGDALAYGLPDSRRAVIEGGGHLCNLSHPREYNRLIEAFARSLAST